MLQRVDVCISPLIRIVPVPGDIRFNDSEGVIFSSSNGVRVASDKSGRRDLPAYCVGRATTGAASDLGWDARCIGTDAASLIAGLSDVKGPLLHLRGVHARGDIAEKLSQQGCPTSQQVIYDQVAQPLSDEAKGRLESPAPVIVPLFSPRTAAVFAKAIGENTPVCIAALSEAVAEPVIALKPHHLLIAPSPDARSMCAIVEKLVNLVCRVESDKAPQ